MFIDYNLTIIPTAAIFVFLQKLFFALTKIHKELVFFCFFCFFWNEFSVAQTDLWWNHYKSTTANCLSCSNFEEAISFAEVKIASFLKQFISGASKEILSLLLQFSAGASNFEVWSSIQVWYVDLSGNNLHITLPAWFKILTLSMQYCFQTCFGTVSVLRAPKNMCPNKFLNFSHAYFM